MRRARVRVVLIVVVLGTLTGIGFLIGQTMVEQRRAAEETADTLLAPEVAQSIRQFHRVKVEEGRTVWDLRADKADFLDEGRVLVEVPELSFFSEDGQAVRLSGATGEVQLDGPEVGRIDLRGGIEVTVGPYRLETPQASWVGAFNAVVAAEGVDLRGRGFVVTGDKMIVELDTRRVRVEGDVRTVLNRTTEEGEADSTDGGAEASAEGETGAVVPASEPPDPEAPEEAPRVS